MATGQYNSFPIDWKSIDASKVPYSNATSGLSATDVQGAIDELNTDLNAIDASDIPYDNTASGLTADDVQEALDELASEKQDELTAGDGITISSDTISTDNDATLTSAVKPAQAKAVGDALALKANSDGNYEDMTVGTADSVLGTPVVESVPYLFRRSASIGVRESDKIIGGTIAWNQLVQNGNFEDGTNNWGSNKCSIATVSSGIQLTPNSGVTSFDIRKLPTSGQIRIPSNHKVLFHLEFVPNSDITILQCGFWNSTWGTSSKTSSSISTGTFSGVLNMEDDKVGLFVGFGEANNLSPVVVKSYMITDLTKAFGTEIADYVYSLEQTTEGSGIAWLKSHGFFTKDYYAYDSGSLQSVKTSAHKTTGKNFMPFNLTSAVSSGGATLTPTGDGGFIVNGTTTSATTIIVWNTESVTGGTQSTQNPNKKTVPNGTYRFTGQGNGVNFQLRGSNTENADGATVGNSSSTTVTVDDTYKYNWFRVALSAGTYNNVVVYPMLLYSDVSDATYEPYESHTYPLSLIDLRGIPKLDAQNKLYYDGDEYKSDGTVVRRYNFITISSTTATTNMNTSEYGNWVRLTNLPVSVKDDSRVCLLTSSQAVTTSYDDRTTLPSSRKAYIDNNGAVCLRVATNDNVTTASQILALYDGCQIQYELVTPTTETADPFHDPQICSPYGTEEYIDTRDVPVPVGHETEYYTDPVAEIERVAVQVPVPPTANGTYRLTCVVSGGVPTYSWTS